ncbi:uncharacterized protein LOC132061170 [Lycium ferocissimum]|uniref:uncharacterized protein LOC132061170 n=1 Tax=Lycium ferocissimum TaxID=112874 RepID=UPI00281628AF|nr:uncharacterized protein LOC132061170 [Lycium ferocissimum]
MEQARENSRVTWRTEVVKTFLETCIQEVSLNGRLGSSLKPDSWNKAKVVLETSHDFVVTQKKMKNQYDYLNEKYQAWLPITKKTDNVYDPTTNTIRMSNEKWDEYITAHPKAKTLRRSNLRTFQNLQLLIDKHGTASVSTHIVIDSLDDIEDRLGDKNDGASKDSSSQSSIPIENKNLGKKRKNTTSRLPIDEKMNAALELLINKNNALDEEECIKKLDGLGWGEPLYSAALSIFCEGDSYKKTWMKLSGVNKLENYVKTMGKKWEFFDFAD